MWWHWIRTVQMDCRLIESCRRLQNMYWSPQRLLWSTNKEFYILRHAEKKLKPIKFTIRTKIFGKISEKKSSNRLKYITNNYIIIFRSREVKVLVFKVFVIHQKFNKTQKKCYSAQPRFFTLNRHFKKVRFSRSF